MPNKNCSWWRHWVTSVQDILLSLVICLRSSLRPSQFIWLCGRLVLFQIVVRYVLFGNCVISLTALSVHFQSRTGNFLFVTAPRLILGSMYLPIQWAWVGGLLFSRSKRSSSVVLTTHFLVVLKLKMCFLDISECLVQHLLNCWFFLVQFLHFKIPERESPCHQKKG
jgi:hypothetical protein